MILGDHVLFDISPNITLRPYKSNPLKDYLESLENIKTYDVEIPLPAHRESGSSLTQRVDELLLHHQKRLQEVIDIVGSDPGLSCYNIAARMTWSIKAKNWGEFPTAQKWFAVSEAAAHLNYLIINGSLKRESINGAYKYSS